METSYTILRIRKDTHRKLRRIAAMCDEAMIATIERLATQELARLEQAERSIPGTTGEHRQNTTTR